MRILAFHAHPDDIEILAGGSMALAARAGHSITIATMTPGDCGSVEYDGEETARVRRAEAAASAAVIGAEYLCAEFRDLAVFNDDSSRRRVTELIRRARPAVVLAASPIDYHCDHEAASALVRDACFACSAPNYATRAADPAPALDAIPHLYYVDSLGGVDRDGRPQVSSLYVDVGSVFQTKREMLSKHASQRHWLRRQHGMDEYLDTMERWTKEIGARVGVQYAEGFRIYPGHPYPQSPLLDKVFEGYVRYPD